MDDENLRKLGECIDDSPPARDVIRAAAILNQQSRYVDAQIILAVAADVIASRHPELDAIQLVTVLRRLFLVP